ncbi:hypothetical protein M6B38_341935 [Iris pallida]|uniref:Uncharacterized protein n=1 Tax=Iris pallida TaxID=29817 RepID=A0AAX6GX14_IRIPA|nr:hypothetical protein M6B38_341935 [Iris pallida]
MRLSERTRGRSWGSYRGRRGRCWRGRGGGEGGGLGISNFIEEAVQYLLVNFKKIISKYSRTVPDKMKFW